MGETGKRRSIRPVDRDLWRKCFVIMPFGEKTRDGKTIDFDKIYNEIIKPAVVALRRDNIWIECIRSDKVEQAGLVHERMIQLINEADVAVVDITFLNPNVFYELGVRHTLHERVTVLIRQEGTTNPFNIAGMSTINYNRKDADQARTAISNAIRNGLVSSVRDSLVHQMLPRLNVSTGYNEVAGYHVYRYRPPDVMDRELCIVTGDLRYVNLNPELHENPIDIWVSSENINMKMARVFDTGVSALIRYLGATKDATGQVIEDTIAEELVKIMNQREQVNPGIVVPTGSGKLLESHGVRRIYHAASVYGTVGQGFNPIANIEHCITAALQLATEEGNEMLATGQNKQPPYRSILFPLLGTGTAKADLLGSAKKQFRAALTFLGGVSQTPIERVCFIAPTREHLVAFRLALAEMGLSPVRLKPDASAQSPRKRRKKSAAAKRAGA